MRASRAKKPGVGYFRYFFNQYNFVHSLHRRMSVEFCL
jgi:hypothetical protein